jgi:hypothetical protein
MNLEARWRRQHLAIFPESRLNTWLIKCISAEEHEENTRSEKRNWWQWAPWFRGVRRKQKESSGHLSLPDSKQREHDCLRPGGQECHRHWSRDEEELPGLAQTIDCSTGYHISSLSGAEGLPAGSKLCLSLSGLCCLWELVDSDSVT